MGAERRIFRRGFHVRGDARPLRQRPKGCGGRNQGEPEDRHERFGQAKPDIFYPGIRGTLSGSQDRQKSEIRRRRLRLQKEKSRQKLQPGRIHPG